MLDEVYASEPAAVPELFEQCTSHECASVDVATVARAATYSAVDTVLVD